ncbi:polysaccharide deacetylase family protein [Niabella drilacis]|uniref:Peptidoglycan/xylan/chitin deacetylase, PgdA/CDA1 family n=1 Tax=Niabella drilacis (strain DSM 25811 / CCM 8410 / CCUG 62505 / LMG 26954 / E90) TaxID=1285928 RepID=A0A1G6VN74_NIADE|nr:polysaccharide deacetylase family protein [Niabella drilacis]SDD54335.1 Peptidoglycan/xylan/chitin deacetylase, PgdA/CDA1 family [Niabella drilacis]
MYFVKTPWLLKKIYPHYIWDLPASKKKIFLTFDDGPHPVATPFVLEQLRSWGAKASFFCVGKNVVAEKELYETLQKEGHAIGNHTHNHLNGWKTDTRLYLENVQQAAGHIDSGLFRPPYGRIRKEQGRLLTRGALGRIFRIVMWDVLSGDFDRSLSPERCLQYVLKNTRSGSVIVFHDSEKAFKNMSFALPGVLQYFSERGFTFEALPDGSQQ